MKKRLITGALTLALVLSGCGGAGAPSGSGGQGGAGGKSKDLVVIKNADILSMDSSKATDEVSFETLGSTNEGLYVMGADGVEKLAGASEVKVSKDNTEYVFTIRDSQWSNGDPVTAHDYVYAWRRLVDPNTASEYAFIMDTAGVENAEAISTGKKPIEELGVRAIDDKTLMVKLSHPVAYFGKILTFGSFMPLNQKFCEAQGDQYATKPEALLSNGPFKMSEWNIGNSFKVVKNDKYWDAANVKLDSITWKIAKDSQSAALAFDTGEADFVRLSGDIIDNFRQRPELKQELGGYLWFLIPNRKVKELENKNLTLAIANAIDRNELAANILKDGAQGANYFIPEKLAASPSGEDYRAQNGKSFFAEGAEKAKAYAKKAFEELGTSSVKLELLYEDTDESKKVAEFIKIQVEKNVPGLTLDLKSQPKKARIQLQLKGEFQLTLHRWGPDYPDPSTYFDLFTTDSNYNYGKYSDPEYDKLNETANDGSQTPEERWKLLLEAEKILLRDAQGPIPVYQVGNSTLWSKRATGIDYHPVGVSYYYKHADIK